jgi:hypothetical protein
LGVPKKDPHFRFEDFEFCLGTSCVHESKGTETGKDLSATTVPVRDMQTSRKIGEIEIPTYCNSPKDRKVGHLEVQGKHVICIHL